MGVTEVGGSSTTGAAVGDMVGEAVGEAVGGAVGESVSVGRFCSLLLAVGAKVGVLDGIMDGLADGAMLTVGAGVVGCLLSSSGSVKWSSNSPNSRRNEMASVGRLLDDSLPCAVPSSVMMIIIDTAKGLVRGCLLAIVVIFAA